MDVGLEAIVISVPFVDGVGPDLDSIRHGQSSNQNMQQMFPPLITNAARLGNRGRGKELLYVTIPALILLGTTVDRVRIPKL